MTLTAVPVKDIIVVDESEALPALLRERLSECIVGSVCPSSHSHTQDHEAASAAPVVLNPCSEQARLSLEELWQ